MQPRFVRNSSYSSSKTKSRFAMRNHLRLNLLSIFSFLGIRRAKCSTRTTVALVLAITLSLTFLVLFRPLISRPKLHVDVDVDDPTNQIVHIPLSVDDVLSDAINITEHADVGIAHDPTDQSSHQDQPAHFHHDTNIKLAVNDTRSELTNPHDAPASDQVQHPDNFANALKLAVHDATDQKDVNDTTATDPIRQKFADGKLSVVILFHNEYDSLNTALQSWINNRLINYADEILFFLNGVRSESTFRQRVPEFESKIPSEKRRLELSPENLPLGLAITRMVELAKHEYILLLEKDWELIENEAVMQSRLTDSKVLVGSGLAHVVRHRHRHNPGVPLHALIMHQGREESIFRQQPNLLCYVHHWQADPTASYPGIGIMRRCGGADNHVVEKDVYCSSSRYCNWSNNPALFQRKWFLDEVGERYRKEYETEKSKYGTTSPFLDFEYYTNWRSYAWTDRNFTVALGTGLFRHAETEHQHFNTFWYAHYRLTVDLEELRLFYLRNETKLKQLGGVHYDTDFDKPLTMMQRYPVEFVQKFQWEPAFSGTLEKQREAIATVYDRYLQNVRLTDSEWNGTGPLPPKGSRRVDWRGEITQLHNAVEKAMMLVPPEQPHEMSITLVTTVLDIGRDGLDSDEYQFRREFQMYLDAMAKWLTHKYPKVVYTSKAIADELLKTASEEVKNSTKFVYTSKQEIQHRWLGADNFARVQDIRLSQTWRDRASWLSNSPQAALEYYNPLVMSKMFMMRDAARENFWNTTHFLFIDAKHNCQRPEVMTPLNDHIIRAHMFDKLLLTTFDYSSTSEVHGFEYETFNSMCNMENPSQKHEVRVGRGGIFGGSAFVLEFITAMYDVALTATLREGLMGTEENILSILLYNVRQYVDEFSNDWACPENLEKDHKCAHLKERGYNCAIFDWVARNAVPFKQS